MFLDVDYDSKLDRISTTLDIIIILNEGHRHINKKLPHLMTYASFLQITFFLVCITCVWVNFHLQVKLNQRLLMWLDRGLDLTYSTLCICFTLGHSALIDCNIEVGILCGLGTKILEISSLLTGLKDGGLGLQSIH